ncbi:PPE family protein [Mycobacterium alsense]|nr:PPE family protein [Mycobacterium alsense]
MSFLTSSPEINSAQLYSGAGPGPLLAAAAAWDGLAAELGSAASSFASVTSELAGQAWQGPASVAMAAAAAPYAQWLGLAATQASGAATQVKAVVSAYETARAAVVHPLAVAANRTEMVSLVVSNLFGFNAPAIAEKEAEYERMWATDVAAMVGYHGLGSAAAAQLTPWQQALQNLSGQAAAAAGPRPAATAIEYGLIAALIAGRISGGSPGPVGPQPGGPITAFATAVSTGVASVERSATAVAGEMATAVAPAVRAIVATPVGAAAAGTVYEVATALGASATTVAQSASAAGAALEHAVVGAGAAFGQAVERAVAQGSQGIVALTDVSGS